VKVTASANAAVRSAVYATGNKAIVFVANFDRDAEHEVTIALDPAAVFPGRPVAGIKWRDLDPGLEPPQVAVASAAEIAKEAKAARDRGLDDTLPALDAEQLDDFLSGDTPEARANRRLELREEGSKARVTIRPRDYRVLEATPGG